MNAGPDPTEQLNADYPNWHSWRSKADNGDDGAWYSTRRGVLTEDEMTYGLVHTACGDTEGELRAALETQRSLERARRREMASREPIRF